MTTAPHGNETRYCAGCRCDDCRAAHAAGARRRRRMKAYGRHVPKSIPNSGARRRVQALMRIGWSMRAQSRMLGWHPDRLCVMLSSYDGISPRNHARVSALYDRLWDKPAPQRTKGERIAANRTIAAAIRLGYLPPLAWDDEEIDTAPAARPCGTHAAFNRHKARGERIDARCARAERAYQAARDRRRTRSAAA